MIYRFAHKGPISWLQLSLLYSLLNKLLLYDVMLDDTHTAHQACRYLESSRKKAELLIDTHSLKLEDLATLCKSATTLSPDGKTLSMMLQIRIVRKCKSS